MADKPFAQDQVQGLIAKLNGVDFTDEERSILHAVFRAAAGDDVEGFDTSLWQNVKDQARFDYLNLLLDHGVVKSPGSPPPKT